MRFRHDPELTIQDTLNRFRYLSKIPQLTLTAYSDFELRVALEGAIKSLFRNVAQFELFLVDGLGGFIPVGGTQLRREHRLLAALRARLSLHGEDQTLAEPQLFEKLLGIPRGSIISAPLRDGKETLGLIVIQSPAVGRQFDAIDLDVLERLAAVFSLATQRVRSKQVAQAHQRVERDLKAARRVQRDLMSASLPSGIGVAAYCEYRPALDVGGDFYDVAHLGDGLVAGVVGDVSGKGVTAALMMSRVSSEFRRLRDKIRSPAEVLRCINDELLRDDSEVFTTASCFTVDAGTRQLTVSSAGHLPLIIRRASGGLRMLGAASGTPLGMLPTDYVEEALTLASGDIVLAMTDGLVEALDRPSDRLGMNLLRRLISYAPHDPRVLIEHTLQAVDKMQGAKPPDDVTLLALVIDP